MRINLYCGHWLTWSIHVILYSNDLPSLVICCNTSVCSFWMKWSSLATWHAVRGLSPVIITTWKQSKKNFSSLKPSCLEMYEWLCCQIIYMMRCFLDLSDDSLAVTFEGARHNHEPSKLQVTLQSIATHLPDLCEPQTSSSVSLLFTYRTLWSLWEILNNNLLVT